MAVRMELRKQELLEARFRTPSAGGRNGGQSPPVSASHDTTSDPSFGDADSQLDGSARPKARKRQQRRPDDSSPRCRPVARDAGSDDSNSSRSSGGGGGGGEGEGGSPRQAAKRKRLQHSGAKLSPRDAGSSCSPPHDCSCSSSSCSQETWPTKMVQTDDRLPDAGGDSATRAELATLQKAKEELGRQVAQQQKLIGVLKVSQERCRETLRSLLIDKAEEEKRRLRRACRENKLRLGQFHIVRHGSNLEDKWFDGWAFESLQRRRQEIEALKEKLEKEKRQWNKRRPAAAKSSSAASRSASRQSEIDADEFFTQLEIYDIQRQALIKDEKDVRDEVEKLDRERNVHICEMKRMQNEDSSRFKGNQSLHSRYLLLSLLGKGGFSEVHKAYDLSEHRYVACKIHQLNGSWPKEKKDNYIRHAVREIEIHKTLQHPRIVKVYDVFDIDSDCFCTVLEYSRGCDLDFYLKQNKSLPEREARNIICQVVSALKYLNQRKPPVIHYDLKPGNILLGENDSAADVKLTDFGLSKVMTEDKFHPDCGMELTSQGAGTYWYLPPECFETGPEAPKISSKVDVWSVGVIFYQCLYGQKPFGHNMSQADILRNHTILKAQSIEFPASAPGNTKVTEQAKSFIRRCVTYDKQLRPDVFQLAEHEYLKSKAQLKHDTWSQAASCGLMPPPHT